MLKDAGPQPSKNPKMPSRMCPACHPEGILCGRQPESTQPDFQTDSVVPLKPVPFKSVEVDLTQHTHRLAEGFKAPLKAPREQPKGSKHP